MTRDSSEVRRRGHGHPSTADLIYDADEAEFLMAMEEYQKSTGRKFPTWTEALRVMKSLGYAKPFDVDT